MINKFNKVKCHNRMWHFYYKNKSMKAPSITK